jgi:hypothetical protein
LTLLNSAHLIKDTESISDVWAPIREILLYPVTANDELDGGREPYTLIWTLTKLQGQRPGIVHISKVQWLIEVNISICEQKDLHAVSTVESP